MFKQMSATARLNTKKLLGFLISFTVRKDTMLMALRKNPSIPAGGKQRGEMYLYFLASHGGLNLSARSYHPDLILNNGRK